MELMISFKNYLIDHKCSTKKAILKINKLGGSSLVVTSKGNILKGILSSADLRKAIITNKISNETIEKIYNKKPKIFYKDQISSDIDLIISKINKLHIVPIINKKTKKIIDIYDIKKINTLKQKNFKKLDASIVIMAGGKGTRLLPFTSVLPKPLLPINNKPAIKHIIDKFQLHGKNDIFITVNYKSSLLSSYFKSLKGETKIIKIIHEKKPLGTVGGLFNIKNRLKKNFFLTNCDTFIKANYNDMLKNHLANKSDLTIIVTKKKFEIPYGVCEKDNDKKIIFKEKPEFKFNINTGFYLLNKNCLKLLKKREYLDFNIFLKRCINNKKKINLYHVKQNQWLDIGQKDKYMFNLNKKI